MTLKVLVCEACHGTGGKNYDCPKCRGVGRYREVQYDTKGSYRNPGILSYLLGYNIEGEAVAV